MWAMKALLAFAVILALCAQAQARLAPIERDLAAMTVDDMAIDSGASGASLESDYFRAPQPPFAAVRIFPCRLQLRVFE
jgi:hypothetical protein